MTTTQHACPNCGDIIPSIKGSIIHCDNTASAPID